MLLYIIIISVTVSSGDNKTTDAPSHIDQNGDILRCTEGEVIGFCL